MIFDQYSTEEGGNVKFSRFPGQTADEYHLMITPAPAGEASSQFLQIETTLSRFMESRKLTRPVVFFQRFFASDLCNQEDIIHSGLYKSGNTALAAIQQPSADGRKLLAWIFLVDFHTGNPEIRLAANSFSITHNNYKHLFTSGLIAATPSDSFSQTHELFGRYLEILNEESMTLEANCMRTWIFVRDIDNHYQGMVKARNQVFSREGLTGESHYIASTGIEGQTARPHCLVGMDAYALGGTDSRQVRYLKGSSHLSPTHVYGVAFERGTVVEYGDRRQIFISGTASIDHRGEILHPRDVKGQTSRVFENIRVLLGEAGAGFGDVSSMIVYIRDLADRDFMNYFLNRHYPELPYLVVLAPICRHGWLVEVECTATREGDNPGFRNF